MRFGESWKLKSLQQNLRVDLEKYLHVSLESHLWVVRELCFPHINSHKLLVSVG